MYQEELELALELVSLLVRQLGRKLVLGLVSLLEQQLVQQLVLKSEQKLVIWLGPL